MSLELAPITLQDAKAFVREFHRHHPPPVSGLFAISAVSEGRIRAVVIVGRPVSRITQAKEPRTAEVTRLASDGTRNACSMLYGAAARACRALGYSKLITYTLVSEPGSSLRAAGYRVVWQTRARSWNFACRPREDKSPTCAKQRWELAL